MRAKAMLSYRRKLNVLTSPSCRCAGEIMVVMPDRRNAVVFGVSPRFLARQLSKPLACLPGTPYLQEEEGEEEDKGVGGQRDETHTHIKNCFERFSLKQVNQSVVSNIQSVYNTVVYPQSGICGQPFFLPSFIIIKSNTPGRIYPFSKQVHKYTERSCLSLVTKQSGENRHGSIYLSQYYRVQLNLRCNH